MMARFVTYAEVLSDDHPQSKLFRAGKVTRQPGRLLRDYLTESGGAYEFRMPISDHLKSELAQVASLTEDRTLHGIASKNESVISLEHLRHLDPDSTRIVCGQRIEYTEDEARALRLHKQLPPQ